MATYVGEIILVAFDFEPPGYARCDGRLLLIDVYDTLFNLIGTTYGGDGVTTFALPDLRGRVPLHRGQGGGLSNYMIGEPGGYETITLTPSQMPAHTHLVDATPMTAIARCTNGSATTTSPVGALPAIETAGSYTDATLIPGVTTARAAHVIELRSRVDSARIANGLAAFAWSDPITPATTMIRAQHILDFRTAIGQIYAQRGLTPPTYTDPQLIAGDAMKAVHISELRSAAQAIAVDGTALRYSNLQPDSNMQGGAIAVSGAPSTVAAGGNQQHKNMQPYQTINYIIALDGVFPSQS